MGVLRSRYIMHLLMIQLLGCFGWLCNIALAQLDLGEGVTGSVGSPDLAIACFANLSVFVTSLLRGRLDLEIGARDVLATMRVPGRIKLREINKGFGLTTCDKNKLREASVVMLSYDTPIPSMEQFMKYFAQAYKVHSILLQCFPLKSKFADLLPGLSHREHECTCIVFTCLAEGEEIVMMLAHRMPGTLKRLTDIQYLLPSPQCLQTGCHGLKQDLLYVEETEESGREILKQGVWYVEETEESGKKILEDVDTRKGKMAIREIFQYINGRAMERDHSCICIPLSPQGYDQWTQLLKRSMGVRGWAFVKDPSFVVPRVAEVLLNLLLTGWFRVDGLSSALVARRAIGEYVAQGGGFAANAFLAGGVRYENNDCCVLRFRGGILSGTRSFSFIIGCTNFICLVAWVVLTIFQGSIGKWYDTRSVSPSIPRIVIIMVAICMAMGMDCLHLYLRTSSRSSEEYRLTDDVVVWCVIALEVMFILLGSIITRFLGIQVLGRWLYGALHLLVWIKWATGSYLLGDHPPEYENHPRYNSDNGILVYSSAFWLNSILAGVRCNWNYSLYTPN